MPFGMQLVMSAIASARRLSSAHLLKEELVLGIMDLVGNDADSLSSEWLNEVDSRAER